ncbi:MAG: peptidylprolyl isomerase [Hoeflea sp.]|nr:peptidylprolyl isomerase [Hoeflea sp.]|tara:strand:+ start:643 stop:1557 length:915 start_codon:yes stop_codon:yes gene_type:complete
MRHTKLVAAVFLASSVLMSSGAFAAEGDDPVVAKVGDAEIHESELTLAQGELDPQFDNVPAEQRRLAALAAVIDIKSLARKAESEDLENTPEFKTQMNYLRDRTLHNVLFKKEVVDSITDEEVKARYEKEIAATPPEEEVKARHILLKTEDEAKAVIKELEDGADFVELAKEKSTGPSASEGGDLGYFRKGRMVPAFEEAAFGLQKGEFTKEPIKSEFGWHVIKVEDRREAEAPALEQVAPQVRQVLLREKYAALLEAARSEVEVDIVDPALKEGYDTVMKQQDEAKAATENGADSGAEAPAEQ